MNGVRLLIGVSILALGGCATLDKSQCLGGNWYRIGYQDGAQGRPASRMESHREACAQYGRGVNPVEYHAGRERGLVYHCADSEAYKRTDRAIAADRGDWRAIGYEHGEAGRRYAPEVYRSQCAKYGITLQDTPYHAGYDEGIQHFCKPDKGYDLGRAGLEFPRGLCGDAERAMGQSYLRGLDAAIDEVDADITHLVGDLAGAITRREGKNAVKPEKLEKDLETLRNRRAELRNLRMLAPR